MPEIITITLSSTSSLLFFCVFFSFPFCSFLPSSPSFFSFHKSYLDSSSYSWIMRATWILFVYLQYFIHEYIKELSAPGFFQIVTSHALFSSTQSIFGIHHSTEIAFIKVNSDPVAKLISSSQSLSYVTFAIR